MGNKLITPKDFENTCETEAIKELKEIIKTKQLNKLAKQTKEILNRKLQHNLNNCIFNKAENYG